MSKKTNRVCPVLERMERGSEASLSEARGPLRAASWASLALERPGQKGIPVQSFLHFPVSVIFIFASLPTLNLILMRVISKPGFTSWIQCNNRVFRLLFVLICLRYLNVSFTQNTNSNIFCCLLLMVVEDVRRELGCVIHEPAVGKHWQAPGAGRGRGTLRVGSPPSPAAASSPRIESQPLCPVSFHC